MRKSQPHFFYDTILHPRMLDSSLDYLCLKETLVSISEIYTLTLYAAAAQAALCLAWQQNPKDRFSFKMT